MTAPSHLITLRDLPLEEIDQLLIRARDLKRGVTEPTLRGKSLGLIFFNPSLRTRTSFQVAMFELGGQTVLLSSTADFWELETQEGAMMDGEKPEHVTDAARVLARYVDGLAIRTVREPGPRYREDRRDEAIHLWARHSTVPVFNLESMLWHPLQALADLLTMREALGSLRGKRLALTWTANPEPQQASVANSLLLAAARFGMEISVAHPAGYELDEEIVAEARRYGPVRECFAMGEGVEGADVVYARSWGSLKHYGQPTVEAAQRGKLRDWIVNRDLMARTREARFMNAMPVRRNVVVTDDVIDGAHSLVYDQAENRLHTQKAVLERFLAT
jgi:N-acetylornithine carbamoyltransferase